MANYNIPVNLDKRLRYFHGQFLQDQDFIDEQHYHVDRKRRHDRLLHSAGIGEGLGVTLNAATAQATVAPGTAFDNKGRQIVLQNTATVSLTGFAGRTVFVLISYQQQPSDPSTFTGGAGDTRWHELPLVEVVPEGQVPIGDEPVRLTRFVIDLDGNITGPDNVVRHYAGLRLPEPNNNTPTLHAGAPNRADLTGSLQIDNNLTVSGSTTLNSLNILGNQTVGGSQTVNGSLTVIGTSDLRSNTRIRGSLDIDNSLNLQLGTSVNEFSTDTSLSGNSDTAVPTERAVKAYADAVRDYIDSLLVGSVAAFAMEAPPTGWLECNGAAISRFAFARLFAVIGTRFGMGNGATNFNIPDLRGHFIRGWSHGAGNDPDRNSRTNWFVGGVTGDAVGSYQFDAYRSHTHSFSGSSNSTASTLGSHSHGGDDAAGWTTVNPSGLSNVRLVSGFAEVNLWIWFRSDFSVNSATVSHSHSYTPSGSNSFTGGNETRPENISLMFCIKH
jgi:microcystin-dependent protein